VPGLDASRHEHDRVVGVAELQRARMLHSAVQVVSEEGYGQMSVARVTGRAGVSRRTFYEMFGDREACFLAAFDQAVSDIQTLTVAAWERESSWRRQIRAALGALLGFLDEEPGIGSLVVVEALGAGPRVLAHRSNLLSGLASVIDLGRSQSGRYRPPALTAEGLVGAVLGIIHARLLETPREPLTNLLSPLVGMIIAPYLGPTAAARELKHPAPTAAPRPALALQAEPLRGLNMRVTYRTLLVLSVIGEHPGASNRQVADHAGVSDQGQISKLLTRLENLGLIHNTVPKQPTGEPNQWHITQRGHEVQLTTTVKHSNQTPARGETR
jgi:AcrR family transcriptional regulator